MRTDWPARTDESGPTGPALKAQFPMWRIAATVCAGRSAQARGRAALAAGREAAGRGLDFVIVVVGTRRGVLHGERKQTPTTAAAIPARLP